MRQDDFNEQNLQYAEKVLVECVFRPQGHACFCKISVDEPEFHLVKSALIEAARQREQRLNKGGAHE